MKKFILLICLLIPSVASSTTYYVTQSGSGDGLSYENSMSVSAHNADTFLGNDVIYLCDTITSKVVPPNSGSSGSPITYRGDYPSHTALLQPSSGSTSGAAMDLSGLSYITLYNETTRAVMDRQVTSGGPDDLSNANLLYVSNTSNIVVDNWEFRRDYNGIYGSNVNDFEFTRNYVTLMRISGLAFFASGDNITIGGSAENANEFYRNTYKDEYGTNKVGHAVYLHQYTDVICSYNHIHGPPNDDTSGWGLTGIAVYGWSRGVIEHNTIHDHAARTRRAAIHVKGLFLNTDIIIRYNNIYNMSKTWYYSSGAAISITRDSNDIRLYGNRIHHSRRGIWFDINGESGDSGGTNGVHVTDIYIWGNSISDVDTSGLFFNDGYSGNTDDWNAIYAFNNSSDTGYFGVEWQYDSPGSNGTDDSGADPRFFFANNIISNGNDGTQNISFYAIETTVVDSEATNTMTGLWADIDHNLQFNLLDSGNSTVRYNSAYYDYDSASIPNGWMDNDETPADPLFISESTGDLTIGSGSPAIGTGEDLSGISIPAISMEYYAGGSITFNPAVILDPTTDWSVIPPDVQTATNANLDIGAYTYSSGSVNNNVVNTATGAVVNGSINAIIN